MQHVDSSSLCLRQKKRILSAISSCQPRVGRASLHRRSKPTWAARECATGFRRSTVRSYAQQDDDNRGCRVSAGSSPAAAVLGGSAGGDREVIPQIAVLSYNDQPEVARVAVENIAAAFESDPSTTYFCRPDQRIQFYRSVMSCLLDWYPHERQLVCTLPPDAAAIAYVYPRLRPLGPWSKLLRGGLAPLLCVRPERLLVGMDASDFFDSQREQFLQNHGPFLYVSVMAVRPGRQGCGLGSALLSFLCDRADAAGLACYIEATSPRNRELYGRFGFELVKEWRANDNMPYTYVLARQPKPLEDEADDQAATRTAPIPTVPPCPGIPIKPYSSAASAAGATVIAPNRCSGDDTGISKLVGAADATCSSSAVDNGNTDSSSSRPDASSPIAVTQRVLQLQAAQLIRRRFEEWRRRQLQQRGAAKTHVQYVEYDEYDMWPFSQVGESGIPALGATDCEEQQWSGIRSSAGSDALGVATWQRDPQ